MRQFGKSHPPKPSDKSEPVSMGFFVTCAQPCGSRYFGHEERCTTCGAPNPERKQ